MRLHTPLSALAILLASGALACSSSTNAGGGAGDSGGGGDAPGLEASGEESGVDAAGDGLAPGDVARAGDDGPEAGGPPPVHVPTGPIGYLRVANWSPDSPSVDFCVSPHGMNAFNGPLVDTLGAVDDSGVGGLSFPSVSAYAQMAPGRYDVRTVAGGGGSCAAGVTADFTTLPALGTSAFMTVALVGDAAPTGGDPGLQLAAFADDFVSGAGPMVRFINASPKLAQVDFGIEAPAPVGYKRLFSAVPFGEASVASEAPQKWFDAGLSVDSQGYAAVAFSGVTLGARAPGQSADVASSMGVNAMGVSTPGSVVVTFVLVGGTAAGGAAHLLECADSAGTVGPFGDCSLLP